MPHDPRSLLIQKGPPGWTRKISKAWPRRRYMSRPAANFAINPLCAIQTISCFSIGPFHLPPRDDDFRVRTAFRVALSMKLAQQDVRSPSEGKMLDSKIGECAYWDESTWDCDSREGTNADAGTNQRAQSHLGDPGLLAARRYGLVLSIYWQPANTMSPSPVSRRDTRKSLEWRNIISSISGP